MDSKRVFKWLACIVAAMILIYSTILVVIIFLIADFDKDTFEALAINAIKNRKALQLGPLENQTLRQYLSE
ncbi:hypothetical protein [Veillonella sp.]|jgi:hypothetical protein|uniref:hypothetical protein n=1 Tax=Veillonella sp. TaxID=1926307 RepID=UPI002913D2B6|nr:hypothetical protein [Veillonella sp.]MDU4009748.1 hypothetical protein [Veillonella sp.]MDU6572432.1 hypothetical protein [Veillonella sp.]